MLDPVITTETGKVSLTYPLMPNFSLQMDFRPIIERFHLKDQFCLVHWQAKPFGERRWGVYDAGNDKYVSLKYEQIEAKVVPQFLQVDENIVKTVPTAVMLFPNTRIIKNGYYSLVSV
jgi:hypothetical protein